LLHLLTAAFGTKRRMNTSCRGPLIEGEADSHVAVR
jgi:hypothetical protein